VKDRPKRYTLKKSEMLKSPKAIQNLFEQGESIFSFPYKLMISRLDDHASRSGALVSFSVPKRNHKKAVTRNLLKRRMKECYRQNKPVLSQDNARYALMYILVDKSVSDYEILEKAMIKINTLLVKHIDAHKSL